MAITRPTVIAWFVIPPGAVDTMPDLAVEADDWNVNMATLRDSLESSGIDLAMVLDSAVTVTAAGRRDTVLTLGAFRSAGYAFVRTNGLFCVRRGGSEADTVIATARAYVNGRGCT